MRAPSRLGAMQARARTLMTLTLAAYSPAGETTNPGGYTETAYAPEGTTPGRIQGGTRGKDTATRYVEIGGVKRPVLEGALQIPLTAPVPVAGEQRGQIDGAWEYEVTAIGELDDPALLGRRYMVVEAPAKSHATMRRLSVIEL